MVLPEGGVTVAGVDGTRSGLGVLAVRTINILLGCSREERGVPRTTVSRNVGCEDGDESVLAIASPANGGSLDKHFDGSRAFLPYSFFPRISLDSGV